MIDLFVIWKCQWWYNPPIWGVVEPSLCFCRENLLGETTLQMIIRDLTEAEISFFFLWSLIFKSTGKMKKFVLMKSLKNVVIMVANEYNAVVV